MTISTILVVDDNPFNREIAAEHLTSRGHDVLQAEGGRQALELIERQRVDAVILDVMMPGMDGREVLGKIRERYALAELPVIMATARVERDEVVESLRLGANDYVLKPIDFALLLARLDTQLALKRAHDEIRRAQEQIARLTESAAEALHDATVWSASVATELAALIGARSIGVWLADGRAIWSVGENATHAPTDEDLEIAAKKRVCVRGDETIVAVTGITGELFGALVVSKLATLGDPEQKLLFGFARQLGSALEVQRMRGDLSAAQGRLVVRRQEMLDRGIDILYICPMCGRCYDQNQDRCDVDGWTVECPRLLPFRIRGRYRFVRSITTGGMAKLYEAHDEKLDRAVAVKLIKPEYFNDAEMRMRFEQEARAVARIDHPGVVAVYDSGELEEGSLFFVMELLRGMNLGQLLQRHGRGTPRQVAALVRQVGAALNAAHRAGFIHRDIKPDNIFLLEADDGLRAKLLDFGIAKPIGVSNRLTQTGTFIGTPAYMSPEQVSGEPIDVRSDIYSLAAVTYEALSGTRIVPEKANVFASDILQAAPAPVLGAPDAVQHPLFAALAKEPVARPADAGAWSSMLATALESMTSDAPGWPMRLGHVEQTVRPLSTKRAEKRVDG
jgi:CheY-like chemotaxis protein/tRNA A-37 threonylcarbamoyl transferase component Bud32